MALRPNTSLQDEAVRRGKTAAATGGIGPSAGSGVSGGLPPYRVGMTPAAPPINTPSTIQQQGQANSLRAGVRPPPGGGNSVGKDIHLAPGRGQEMTSNVSKDQSSYHDVVPSTTMASSTGSSSSAGGFMYDTSKTSEQQYKEPQLFQRPHQSHQLQHHLLQREKQVQHGTRPPSSPLVSHTSNSTVFFGVPSLSSAATAPAPTSVTSTANSGLNAPPKEVEPTLTGISWPTRGQKLQSLMNEVDNRFTLIPETSDLLLQMVESFVETVAAQSVRAAKHRNSEVLEVKDIQLCLEKHWGMPWIGVGGMPPVSSRTSSVTPNRPNETLTAAQTKQKSVCAKRKDLK